MIGEYTCPFYHNSGKVCDKPCMRPEGCHFHYRAKKRIPCIDCGKPTGSTSGQYPLHIREYYVICHFDKLKKKAKTI